MQKQESVMVFEEGIEAFMTRIRSSLFEQVKVRLSDHVAPQSLVNLFCDDNNSRLQLRFVVLAVTRDLPLGRLSWLDEQGQDHVCCYVNGAFQCVTRKKNGHWREQQVSADEMCAQRLKDLMAA